jgi:hypothetical protein|tara:strand:+ start:532 stop:837 length:306 start_codon:yes stop_codon:yes gene_type:complete
MGYDSLNAPNATEAVTSGKVDRLQKQLQQTMKTLGNLDERLTTLESMVHASLLKQQDDILGLVADINLIKGAKEFDKAANKFDMEGIPAPHPSEAPVPPVG